MDVKTIGRFVYDSSTPAAVSANGNVPLPTATLNFKSANATSVRVANVIVVKVA